MDKISTEIRLYLNEVELAVYVDNDLKKSRNPNTKNFGNITVSTGVIGSKDCFWDNLEFFFDISYDDFRKECRKELRAKGFKTKETYKDIKLLLKQAFKLKILEK